MAFTKRFKTLCSKLSSIRSFENPIVDYEQYSTVLEMMLVLLFLILATTQTNEF